MKTEHFEKKLTLNKETIAHLKDDELRKVKGGIWESMRITQCSCFSCGIPC